MTVFETLKKAIAESMPEIDIDKVTLGTSIQNDLGLDSLAIMMLSIIVEEEFGFEFDGNIDFDTVGELCDYIENRIN